MATLFCLNISASDSTDSPNREKLELWYNRPATYWEEALPIGNGRLGAMVSGTVAVDTVQLNEDTFWSGSPYQNYNELCLPHLKEMRSLIAKATTESFIQAQKMTMDYVIADRNKTGHGMAYESVGRLLINTGHQNVTDYKRSLDLENATVTVSYNCDGVTYIRTYFSSFIDNLIFIRFEARKNGKVINPKKVATPKLQFIAPEKRVNISVSTDEGDRNILIVKSTLKDSVMENVPNTLDCTTIIRRFIDDKGITVTISCATGFNGYNNPTVDSRLKALYYMDEYVKKWETKFSHTNKYLTLYDKSLYEHSLRYKQQFNRVSLNLGSDCIQSKKDTETRIKEFSTAHDPSLVSLYFQFGRYLLISSSQPNTQPANLQGIWNPDSRFYPAWDSKYTTNINVEMNYWPSEVTNLSECNEPFFKMIKEVSMSGVETARKMYGARGWVLHHNTDIWRSTGAVDYYPAGVWPTGSAWFCSHLWEHFLYTGDKNFLREYYPVMKGASQFFQDYLYRDSISGYMVAGPSISPENSPGIASYKDTKGKKQSCAVFSGVTMDNQLIYDLLRSTSLAARVLNIDKSFTDSLDVLRSQLSPMHIGRYGQLQEWMEDWDKETSGHRHISHLWGAFPGNMISPYTQPDLFAAVHKSLIGRGDASRGWSMGWKVCQWARQQNGNHALTLIKNQLKLKNPNADQKDDENGGTYANMFDAHPPFQIDGNFGCCAGIAEMLVQSYDAAIHILPAVPDEWKCYGKITGLKCRGGFEIVELEWKNGHINHLIIKSNLGGNMRLRSADNLKGINCILSKAEGKNVNPLMQEYDIPAPVIKDSSKIVMPLIVETNLYDIPTEKGKSYEFTIND